MGRPRGLEPPTRSSTSCCSTKLSYDLHLALSGVNYHTVLFKLPPINCLYRRSALADQDVPAEGFEPPTNRLERECSVH